MKNQLTWHVAENLFGSDFKFDVYEHIQAKGSRLSYSGVAKTDNEDYARLIAAAPEIYRCLQQMVKTFDPDAQGIYNFARKIWQDSVDALRKAEGE